MKYIIGFWALMPYSYDENLFIIEEDIAILQSIILDSELEQSIYPNISEKQWYKFNNVNFAANRRFDNRPRIKYNWDNN